MELNPFTSYFSHYYQTFVKKQQKRFVLFGLLFGDTFHNTGMLVEVACRYGNRNMKLLTFWWLRKQERDGLGNRQASTLQDYPQRPTSSNQPPTFKWSATSQNTSPGGDQVFKHKSLWSILYRNHPTLAKEAFHSIPRISLKLIMGSQSSPQQGSPRKAI